MNRRPEDWDEKHPGARCSSRHSCQSTNASSRTTTLLSSLQVRWMLLLFVTASSSYGSAAFSSRAQTTLAQVIKKPQNVCYSGSTISHRLQQLYQPRLLGLCSVSDGGDDEEFDSPSVNGQDQKSRTPRTGWNHNQPDPSSSFWKSASNDPSSRQASQNNPPTNRPRTGWLHNQQPRTAVEKSASRDSSALSSSDSSATTSVARWRLNLAKMQQERNHRILSSPTFHSCGDNGQMVVTEHLISLPLYRNNGHAAKQTTNVFFTIVERVADDDDASRQWWRSLSALSPLQRAQQYVIKAQMKDASSMILYLQGGPGFGAPAPVVGLGFTKDSSWAAQALAMPQFSRVVLMDQRGTGRSSPITKQSLERRFPDLFRLDSVSGNPTWKELEESHHDDVKLVKKSLDDAVRYVSQFRADNIIQDAEEIRDALLLPPSPDEKDLAPRPWGAALGQSFGGFCLMTYLSQVTNPPKVCLLTGGIAPMLTPVYDLYRTLWERVKERNLRYYDMYPDDVVQVKRIVQRLLNKPTTLPSGGNLTARRFLQLGLGLGGSPSSFASLHNLLSSAFLTVEREHDGNDLEFNRAFLQQVDVQQSFDHHPIYFWLHESIYADGHSNSPTSWAAHRAYEDHIRTSPDFDYTVTCQEPQSASEPTLFFGEMVFPWMADGDYAELSGLGLRLLAHALASKKDWPALFDGDHMRKVLQDGSISRAAAAVYYDDLYVDFDASMKVAARGGPLEKCKCWISNEYQHSGLRDNGASIFAKLWGMATGSNRIPS